MVNILSVIPARGGSKRIPRKNMRVINGKPLIYYAMKNALNSRFVSDIVVTSDSMEILDYVATYGIETRVRSQELAGDEVTLDPVVYDAVNYMEKKRNKRYDIIVTLQPTSPLLRTESLDAGIENLIANGLDTIISVTDATHLYWKEDNGRIIPDYDQRLNRQWLKKKFKENGAFVITKREFITENSRFGKKVGVYVLDEIEGVDIDTDIDWILAESLLKRLKIVFVVNGNKSIGMGHVYRVISLSNKLIGHEVSIITYNSDENAINLLKRAGSKLIQTTKNHLLEVIKLEKPKIVINDILDTTKNYVNEIKKMGCFVVNFEDLGDGADEADIVFNDLYERSYPKSNHRYSYRYACIDERFLIYPPIEFRDTANVLLATFGGVDQNNLSERVVRIAPEIISKTTINKLIVIVGPGYQRLPSLKELVVSMSSVDIEVYQKVENMPILMRMADVAITSNGRTVYELTSMGIPTISIAQNDRETLHLFARYSKGVKYLGLACNVTEQDILNSVVGICNNRTREQMYKKQLEFAHIIRNGISRVVDEIIFEYRRWENGQNQDW